MRDRRCVRPERFCLTSRGPSCTMSPRKPGLGRFDDGGGGFLVILTRERSREFDTPCRPAPPQHQHPSTPRTIMGGLADWRRKLRLKASGFCTTCGKKRLFTEWKCSDCARRARKTARERMRKTLGCKPRMEGGRGRPLIDG